MKKHLKLKGELVGQDKVRVTILYREKDNDFGGNGKGSWEGKAHLFFGSTVCMICDLRTLGNFCSPEDGLLDFNVGPAGTSGIVSLAHWKLLKQGVKEYNEWGSQQ